MNGDTINLLPWLARERVKRARAMAFSCRTALALTLVAGAGGVVAEAGRLEALDARDTAERAAQTALARDEHRRRLDAEVRSLALTAADLRRSQGELPLRSILGAVTEALPAGHRLELLRLSDRGLGLEGEIVAIGPDGQAISFVEALAATRPFMHVIAESGGGSIPYVVRFELPADRVYSVVQGDADVSAEGVSNDE